MPESETLHQVVLRDAHRRQWLRFRQPQRILSTARMDEVLPLLQEMEQRVQHDGCYAAGFLAYEAAPAFDSALRVQEGGAFPLLWFGLYAEPEVIDLPRPDQNASREPGEWRPSVTPSAYRRAIRSIKREIAAGNTYQVNYSYRLTRSFEGEPWPYFLQLVQAQHAIHGAFADTGRYAVCSASPELFFRLDGQRLQARPMKGTAARGLTWEQDVQQAEWLQHSEKNRAENVMIVDMIRNDLGRIAEFGSVSVPELFTVERYPTVWQMTSTVTARSEASVTGILSALFPCASITGAPKASTMAIIAGLETAPRRIYTGSIGFVAPRRQAQFNVAIRTALIDRHAGQAEYGVGGGIVWDSRERSELDECLTKARILTVRQPSFQLLETLLWTRRGGYRLLDEHLLRLERSAEYFGYALQLEAVCEALHAEAGSFCEEAYRVRLLVAEDGVATVTSQVHVASAGPVELRRVCLAPEPVELSDPFLYHKTTHRRVYDKALAACPGYDDVLLWNERGEVTESCLANVFVQLEGEWLTPPVSSGLLAGTYRARALKEGAVREQIIHVEDLQRCTEVRLVNSVRGEQRVALDLPRRQAQAAITE